MRLIAFAAAILTVFSLSTFSASKHAQADGHSGAIQTVIESQLNAFKANDLKTAFTFASPNIQGIFKSPERFGRMVKNGYPMVWRPVRYRMGELLSTGAGPVQLVFFEDNSGVIHEAGYLMQEVDGIWRINGVHVRKQPGVGT